MGNLLLSTGFSTTDSTTSEHGRFTSRKISKGITYYYGQQTCSNPERDPEASAAHCPSTPEHSSTRASDPPSADVSSSSSSLPPDTLPHTPVSSTHLSDPSSPARPLLLFLSWLGAHPAVVAKYLDMYLERGMDVLLVQSNVMHFLWPRWGLEYGSEVLKVLEAPPFSGRPVLVYASSIGGYTFTQILTHIAQGQEKHAGLAQRVIGHIYDSLVAGSLEHMATGLGKTLVPRLEGLVKTAAMFYFWLFKSRTADFYSSSIQVFHNSPITAPALFFFCENDALCDPAAVEQIVASWRRRGVAVESRKWKESVHAAHMRCHPEDYLSTLERYLNSLPISSLKAKM